MTRSSAVKNNDVIYGSLPLDTGVDSTNLDRDLIMGDADVDEDVTGFTFGADTL